MGVGFATGVAAKENDFLWVEAIRNLLNGDLGEHQNIYISLALEEISLNHLWLY